MKDFVPLLQTLLWVLITVVAGLFFRRELRMVRGALEKRISEGSSLEFGPVKFGELKEQVRSVQGEVQELQGLVVRLFLATMSDEMFFNLRKVASGKFGEFVKGKALERELHHLRNIGYISCESLTRIPEAGPDLSAYVSITEAGKQFIELRGRAALISRVTSNESLKLTEARSAPRHP